MTDALHPGGGPRTVRVWDLAVRGLHWGLAGAFALAYATGDEWTTLHELAGFAAVGIVGLRLVWGAVGSQRARFSDFVRGPGAILRYLRGLAAGRPERHVGHNPAGGFFAVLLLILVAATGMTGWLSAAGLSIAGAGLYGEAAEELHEALANAALVAVLAHAAAAVVMSVAHRENLIRAMLTGRKRP